MALATIDLRVTMSLEGAESLKRELKGFLRYETRKIAGELPDHADAATLGYVVTREVLAVLDSEIRAAKAIERERTREAAERRAPKTRAGWGR